MTTAELPIERWRAVMQKLGVAPDGLMSWSGRVSDLKLRASTSMSPIDGSLRVEVSIELNRPPQGLTIVPDTVATTRPQPPTGDADFDRSVALKWSDTTSAGPVYACLNDATRRVLTAAVPFGLTVVDGRLHAPHRVTAGADTQEELEFIVEQLVEAAAALSNHANRPWQDRFLEIVTRSSVAEVRLQYARGLGKQSLQEMVRVAVVNSELQRGELHLGPLRRVMASKTVKTSTKAHLIAMACQDYPTRVDAICDDLPQAVLTALMTSELDAESSTQRGACDALLSQPDAVVDALRTLRTEQVSDVLSALLDVAGPMYLAGNLEASAPGLIVILAAGLKRLGTGVPHQLELPAAKLLCRLPSVEAHALLIRMRSSSAACLVFDVRWRTDELTELITARLGVQRAAGLFAVWCTQTKANERAASIARAIVEVADVDFIERSDPQLLKTVITGVAHPRAWSPKLEAWLHYLLHDERTDVRGAVIRSLGEVGTIASVIELMPLTEGFLRGAELKQLAERAIKTIQERHARGASGGLSVAAVADGDLSLADGDDRA